MQPARAITPDNLRLAEGVELSCDWEAGLYTLLAPGGAVPLNRTAASVLALCDGSRTQRDLMVRFGRGDLVQARQVAAFIDAARRRRWVTGGF
jgi:pyrroloquinoline quinone biosynthesis protein D